MSRSKISSAFWGSVGLVGLLIVTSIPACDNPPRNQGKALYEIHCANCHQLDGGGLIGNIPPLAQADWLSTHRGEIACIIRYGMQGPVVVNGLKYDGIMAGVARLTDAEVTNLTNYILTAWNNDLPVIGATEISEQLDLCSDRKPIQLANPQMLGPVR
jgi:mono/diheme cytochrome c family protein